MRRRPYRESEIKAAAHGRVLHLVGYGNVKLTRWTPGGPCFKKLSDPPHFGDFLVSNPKAREAALAAGREALGCDETGRKVPLT